jgi:hypothetical protein
MPGTRWSASDMDILRSEYPHCVTGELAIRLGRKASAVQKMAQLSGIRKTPEVLQAIRKASMLACDGTATRFKPKHGRYEAGGRGTYGAWLRMKQRCNYAGHKSFADYGGRGIKVCAEWENSFETFLRDMGEMPLGHTLGRIDNDAGYSAGNCQWETHKQQARNRRSSVFLEAFGRKQCVAEWADEFGIRADTLMWRLKGGMPVETALAMPVKTPAWRIQERHV